MGERETERKREGGRGEGRERVREREREGGGKGERGGTREGVYFKSTIQEPAENDMDMTPVCESIYQYSEQKSFF